MYYSDEIIEEVRSKNDIVDVISGYVKLKKQGSSYFGLCPFHSEKSPSFSVSRDKQMYYCFGCGAGGNVFTFIMEYENYSFVEALKFLAQRAGVELPQEEYSKEAKERADTRSALLEMNKLAAKYYYAQLKTEGGRQAREYLQNRQLSQETITAFGLGYSSKYSSNLYQYFKSKKISDELLKESGLFNVDEKNGMYDKFWNRVIFPILDVNNRVIGFGGRVMGDGKPKYLNSPETIVFDKSRNLYGLNIARAARKKYLLVCEGYMDVIALHQAGFDNAVASLGTALTAGHANLLKRYTKEVYLTYDSDGAGVKAALRAIPILKEVGITTKVINMRPHKDPDEFIKALGAEAYQDRIDHAENSFMFEIRILEQQYDMKDPESKSAFYHEVAKKLCSFTEKIERDIYIQAVAEKYMLPTQDLQRLVGKYGMQMEGIRKQPTQLKTGINEKNASARGIKKEDGMKQSQKLLLTWLIENTGLYHKIKKYIAPKDFTEEIYHKVAEVLFQQFEESGEANPAKIVSMFPDEEAQKEIAALFNARIHEVESKEDREKALKETIIRIKQNSIKYRSEHLAPTDMAGLMQLVTDKRDLEELEKLHISID